MSDAFAGIIATFIAALSWGFGDFFIQRSVRKIGSLEALFFIGGFGAVVLLPFVWQDIPALIRSPFALGLLFTTIVVTTFTALVDFEALRRGKLSVIEPVMSFELVFTVAIGLLFLHERVNGTQLLLILLIFCGVFLTVIHREPRRWWQWWRHSSLLEAGVILAGIGAILMAFTNVLTGLSSQATNPLVTIWTIDVGLAVLSLLWVALRGGIGRMVVNARRSWRAVTAQSVFDNTAWLAYSYAVTAIPISITIAISESYIALAALLGILWNRERLQRHQTLGMVLTISAAIILAVLIET